MSRAYDELLANQLALLMIRAQMRGQKGRAIKGDGHLKAKAIAALPFTLTDPQKQSLAEIEADMAGPSRMLRLLKVQFDRGSHLLMLLGLATAFLVPSVLLVSKVDTLPSLRIVARRVRIRRRSVTV